MSVLNGSRRYKGGDILFEATIVTEDPAIDLTNCTITFQAKAQGATSNLATLSTSDGTLTRSLNEESTQTIKGRILGSATSTVSGAATVNYVFTIVTTSGYTFREYPDYKGSFLLQDAI